MRQGGTGVVTFTHGLKAEEFLEILRTSKSLDEVSDRLGKSKRYIERKIEKLRKRGYKVERGWTARRPSPERVTLDRFKKVLGEASSARAAAEILGVTPEYVYRRLRKLRERGDIYSLGWEREDESFPVSNEDMLKVCKQVIRIEIAAERIGVSVAELRRKIESLRDKGFPVVLGWERTVR
jgi:biotin operon repressor